MSVEDVIQGYFPNLRGQAWKVTSRVTNDYNCLAWVAGETHRRWDLDPNYYWPIPEREQTIPAFVAAYETRGYVECDNGELENGFEKIAIYAIGKKPLHAARQLPNGRWTSKLGPSFDIEHETVEGVASGIGDANYGTVAVYMKRSVIFRGGITHEPYEKE
ncbi:MAG: hypothetical protein M3362_07625 [Acidobacteriota bacterium]|nr:hypothetical protein [Acidobacteriota bacterium]